MSINSLRPSPYRPLNHPKPLQPRFGSQPGGDGDGLRAGIPPLSTEERAELERRHDFLQQQKEGLELDIKVLKAALGITQDGSSNSVPASEQAPASVEEAEVVNDLPGEAAGTDHQETQTPSKPKYAPRSERTRWNVALDMAKEYRDSNKVWLDMGISVGVGAVCAIGSPVMAVTIPTTIMVVGGIRLMLLLAKIVQDPKGNNIDKMYQKWMNADAEQAKKAADRSA